MTLADFHSMLTLAGIVAFVAMIIWVFGKARDREMQEHARIPLNDDDPIDRPFKK